MSSLSRGLRQQTILTIMRRCCACNSSAQKGTQAALRITSQVHSALRNPSLRRQFHLSARHLSATGSTRTAAKATAAKATASTASTASPQYIARSYAMQLALKKAPTNLYEAPSHFWFRFSSYSAGLFCMSYAVYNYTTIVANPPPGLPGWTVPAFGVIVGFMGAMGTYFILGVPGIVRTIRAVPGPVPTRGAVAAAGAKTAGATPAAKAAKVASSPTAPTAASSELPVHLEIGLSSAVPFFRPRILRVQPHEVELPARLSQLRAMAAQSRPRLDPRLELALEQARKAKAQAQAKFDRDHLMTAPFRHMGRSLKEVWMGLKRALVRDGFVKIKIKGKGAKLDIHGGWTLEDGRPLDRLVTINSTDGRVIKTV